MYSNYGGDDEVVRVIKTILKIIVALLGLGGTAFILFQINIYPQNVQTKIVEKAVIIYNDPTNPTSKQPSSPKYTTEQVSRANVIVNRSLESINVNLRLFNSIDPTIEYKNDQRIACIAKIIETINQLKREEDIIESQVGKNVKYDDAYKYINNLGEYEELLEKLKATK